MAEQNPLLPLQVRPFQTPSIAPTLLALGQLQRGQQQGRINEALLAKGDREVQRQQELQEILAAQGAQPGGVAGGERPLALPQASGGLQPPPELAGGTIDPQALAPSLQPQQQAQAAPGAPQAAQAPQQQTPGQQLFDPALPRRLIERGFVDAAERVLTLQTRQLENRRETQAFQEIRRAHATTLLTGATDEASYQAILPGLKRDFQELGLPSSLLPQHFDQTTKEKLLTMSRTEKGRLAREKEANDVKAKQAVQATKDLEAGRKAREARGQIKDFGLTPTGNAKAAELFPNHPAGQPLSGEQAGQVNAALATEKAQGFAQIQASVATGVAQARAANIRLTPQQLDKTVNRSEILGIAEAITKEFSDANLRKVFGLKNLLVRGAAAARGNPKVLRLLALTGRLRSALLFDKEKGGGSALSTNEQTALESSIITGTELTAEQFIQKRNILQTVAQSTFETGLEGALGSNPKELKRMQALLAKQRRAILTTTPTAPPPSARPRDKAGDNPREAQIRRQLAAQGWSKKRIDTAFGR
jgi:hypothetical protein